MERKLVITGNGLGMALDPQAFSLTEALKVVWSQEHILTEEDRVLMGQCIGREGPPWGEGELDKLHLSITSCDLLEGFSSPDAAVHWLTDTGRRFPIATRNYFHKVAAYFLNATATLPESFVAPLVTFIKDTKSHVATLNYDALLYDAFLANGIFKGYSGYLVDGMLDRGFSEKALERRRGRDFGYYLHLHGSPLFYDEDGVTRKCSRYYTNVYQQDYGRHIVLTHVEHKPSVIDGSDLLSAYWRYLAFCMAEATEVILLGYSGLDLHLNLLLRPYAQNKSVRVVEWAGAGERSERATFWSHRLRSDRVQLLRFDSILSFTEWY